MAPDMFVVELHARMGMTNDEAQIDSGLQRARN